MANRKKEIYKPKPMTEGKRNIIQGLLQEYDIETADDIQVRVAFHIFQHLYRVSAISGREGEGGIGSPVYQQVGIRNLIRSGYLYLHLWAIPGVADHNVALGCV